MPFRPVQAQVLVFVQGFAMRQRQFPILLALVAALAGCGGDSGTSSDGGATSVTPTPSPTTTTAASGCSVRERQDWVLAQMKEWYLFPDLLDATVNPAAYTDPSPYLDALTAPARAQSKDRYFTYITSIAQENAFYASGQSAGFGIRLSYDSTAGRLFVLEAYEGAPALSAGIDRGTEIVAIGDTAASLRTVSSIFAAEGSAGVSAALGPSTAGVTRVLRVITGGVTKDLSVTKGTYEITPVSARYGTKILDNGGTKVGYVNLRTFIDTADPALRTAIGSFRAQGITQVVVDLRYNGGGLVSIAETFGNLLGGDRSGQVFSYTTFRPEKSGNNSTKLFAAQPQSIPAMKIAFIGTGGTASASELVINAFKPYLGTNDGLIGTNTYGKPVGQIALDKAACDDRLRVIAFRTENANHEGDYYTGLASRIPSTCSAGDDYTHALGDPAETSLKVALDFLAGRSCTPISASGQSAQSAASTRRLLDGDMRSTVAREVPGTF